MPIAKMLVLQGVRKGGGGGCYLSVTNWNFSVLLQGNAPVFLQGNLFIFVYNIDRVDWRTKLLQLLYMYCEGKNAIQEDRIFRQTG
jgi:hypothetical protein